MPWHTAGTPLLSPGIQLCYHWVPNCATPRHPAMPSLGHVAVVLPEHQAMASPGHLAEPPQDAGHSIPMALSYPCQSLQSSQGALLGHPDMAFLDHPAVAAPSGTHLCHPQAPSCAVSRAFSCGITESPSHHFSPLSTIPGVPGCAILRHPALPSPAHLDMPFPGI